MLNRLPLSGADVTGLVKVVFMSSHRRITLQEACRMRFFLVRRQKVEIALRWLITNNPLYKEVEVCHEALSSLPLDGIPSEVYNSITFCDKVVEDMMSRSRYDQEDNEEPDEGEATPKIHHQLHLWLLTTLGDSDVSVDEMGDIERDEDSLSPGKPSD